MSAETAGPMSVNATVFACQEQVRRAEEDLKHFGGKDLLGYALSHGLWMDGHRAALEYAESIRRYVDSQKQLAEAVRIATWNARESGPRGGETP